MANRYTGRVKNVSLQEQALANAQKKLDRIDKMREEMLKQVELEMQRLQEMQDVQSDFDFTQAGGVTEPSLGQAQPNDFQSQFDKFNTTPNIERLKTVNESGKSLDFMGVLTTPPNDEPTYNTATRDEQWTTLSEDPGKDFYVSGYYTSSGSSTKRYEYRGSSMVLPLSVGDTIIAPVHYQGHNDGKMLKGHDRRLTVTEIYSKERFTPYHDVLW